MANRKKPAKPKIDDAQDIVDAVIVEEDEAQTDTPDEPEKTAADSDGDTPATEKDVPVTLDEPDTESSDEDRASETDAQPDADSEIPDEPGEGDGVSSVEAQPDADETVSTEDELTEPETVETHEPEPERSDTPTKQADPVVVKRGGFVPMLLGGVAAAVIGFGAARYVLPEGWPWPGAQDGTLAQLTEASAAQESRIDEIAGALNGLNLGDLQGQVAGNADGLAELSQRIDGIAGTLTDLQARIEALETRPVAETGSGDASAVTAELRALQDSVDAQRAEIDTLLSEAQAREAAAEATAQEALARAALSRVQTALDTGSEYGAALDDLRAAGVSVPGALAEQASGVPTLAQLAAAFPGAAREALGAARKAAGEDGGLGGFLRTQLGVRSLEPQEGDSPDAILSRAEAALRDGRLTDALAEIEALPEQGRAALSGWVARAETRQNAIAAAEELAQSLTAN